MIGMSASAGWSPLQKQASHATTPGPIRYGQKLTTRHRRSANAMTIAPASIATPSTRFTSPVGLRNATARNPSTSQAMPSSRKNGITGCNPKISRTTK